MPRDHDAHRQVQSQATGAQVVAEANTFFLQGETLIFELQLVEYFGNRLAEADLSSITATFWYCTKQLSLSANEIAIFLRCSAAEDS